MTWPKPCEVIKIRDKRNILEPIRVSHGVFVNYYLATERVFYGFQTEDCETVSFSTSTVLQIWEVDQTIVFETVNSIYWLVPIDIRILPHIRADA